MSNHSKGPWVTVLNGGIGQLIESADGDVIIYTIGDAGMRCDEKAANASRIVACVNACAGLDTAGLEQLPKTDQPFVARMKHLAEQRDELLMALEGLVARAERFGMGNSTDEYVAAQAVIAKARGDA